MATIEITPTGDDVFRVEVREKGGSTSHEVTASPADVQRFGGGAGAQQLLEASFRFLLEREPKESILPSFDLPVIERYFPEYPNRISSYLG